MGREFLRVGASDVRRLLGLHRAFVVAVGNAGPGVEFSPVRLIGLGGGGGIDAGGVGTRGG